MKLLKWREISFTVGLGAAEASGPVSCNVIRQ